MSKRGKRSQKAITRRKISYSLKTKIWHEAWHCPIWAETICVTSYSELVDFGYENFKENFSTTFIPDVDSGVVLADTRCRGAMQ